MRLLSERMSRRLGSFAEACKRVGNEYRSIARGMEAGMREYIVRLILEPVTDDEWANFKQRLVQNERIIEVRDIPNMDGYEPDEMRYYDSYIIAGSPEMALSTATTAATQALLDAGITLASVTAVARKRTERD